MAMVSSSPPLRDFPELLVYSQFSHASLPPSLAFSPSVCRSFAVLPMGAGCPPRSAHMTDSLPTSGRVFSWSPCSPSPRRSPWPGLSDGPLNASRASFRVPLPPYSMVILVSWSGRTLYAFSGDQRSMGEPAPRARTTALDYCACKPRDQCNKFYLPFARIES